MYKSSIKKTNSSAGFIRTLNFVSLCFASVKSVYRKMSRLPFGTTVVAGGYSKTTRGLVSGFTLVEIMLALSVASIMLASSFVFYQYAYLRENGKDVKNITWNALSTARSYALSGREDSSWGVAFATTTMTVFKGSAFANRDTNFDEEYEFRGAVIGGLSEIYFSKRSGTTTGTQSIVVSNDQNSYTFSINSAGRISVE